MYAPIRNTKSNIATTALTLAGVGTLALALTPLSASAQARGGMRGGFSGPSYSAPSYARPSYSAPTYSAPTYSRPSYTPAASPTYSRPNYTTPSYSGSGSAVTPGAARTGTDFNTLFGRSTPAYNYTYNSNVGGLPATGYRIQQTPGQGQGSRPGAGVPNTAGGGQVRSFPQYPVRQMPLPGAGQFTQSRPGQVNGILTNPAGFNGVNNYGPGYRYRYGVPHGNRYFYGDYGSLFFAGGLAYYPFYSPFYSFGYSALSPYAFYGGFPSFITLGSVYAAPPQYVYVPYPVYENGTYQGYRNEDVDNYYLNRNNRAGADNTYRVGEDGKGVAKDATLEATLNDLRDAWKSGKIDPLAKHVRRDAKVAVYLRGKYQYSLDSGDYLDITRDALSATKTVSFTLDNVQRKQQGVYTITGRHVYRDKDNAEHTVFVTYVLEKADADYVITQVGSAPEKVEE